MAPNAIHMARAVIVTGHSASMLHGWNATTPFADVATLTFYRAIATSHSVLEWRFESSGMTGGPIP